MKRFIVTLTLLLICCVPAFTQGRNNTDAKLPGVGEKTAAKLISQYGSVEDLLAHTAELKGKLRQNLEQHRDRALLSKRLATINCEVPIDVDFEKLKLHPPDEAKLKQLLVEFEFNSIGRRLFGDDFKAGRGLETPAPATASREPATEASSEEAGPAAEGPWEPARFAALATPGTRKRRPA